MSIFLCYHTVFPWYLLTKLLLLFLKKVIHVYEWFLPACMYVFVPGAPGGQKTELDPLEPGLQIV